MKYITWNEFEKIELRTGKILSVESFPEAHKPAYIMTIDFGSKIGIKKSSAQITDLYSRVDLVGKTVIAVVNFPPKQIGPFMSECLVTGFQNEDGHIVLCVPERQVPLGMKLI